MSTGGIRDKEAGIRTELSNLDTIRGSVTVNHWNCTDLQHMKIYHVVRNADTKYAQIRIHCRMSNVFFSTPPKGHETKFKLYFHRVK